MRLLGPQIRRSGKQTNSAADAEPMEMNCCKAIVTCDRTWGDLDSNVGQSQGAFPAQSGIREVKLKLIMGCRKQSEGSRVNV